MTVGSTDQRPSQGPPGTIRLHSFAIASSLAVFSVLGEVPGTIRLHSRDSARPTATPPLTIGVLQACSPRPTALFRIAIEEGEAWLLGDRDAVKAACPNVKEAVLNGYVQDSICGTWEILADAVHPGGSVPLKRAGYPTAGRVKCEWARKITPHMDMGRNRSPSFQVFRDGVKSLAGI